MGRACDATGDVSQELCRCFCRSVTILEGFLASRHRAFASRRNGGGGTARTESIPFSPEFGLRMRIHHPRVEPRKAQNTRKQKDSLASLMSVRLLSAVIPEGSLDESDTSLLLFRVFRVFRGEKRHSALKPTGAGFPGEHFPRKHSVSRQGLPRVAHRFNGGRAPPTYRRVPSGPAETGDDRGDDQSSGGHAANFCRPCRGCRPREDSWTHR